MDNKLLIGKVDKYNFVERSKEQIQRKVKRRIRKRHSRLNWVHVASPEFKEFVKKLKRNCRLDYKDQAWTICWGRVPYTKKQKHMEHCQYIINAEFFKDAKTFLILCKSHNMIDNDKVALFEDVVPDTVYECERDDSNTNQKFFATDLKASKKRAIVEPIKHSTLLRNDVSSQRLINENDNVKYHFANQWERVKESLMKNDDVLQNIVSKLKSIMDKNELQKMKLVSMENTCLHIHSSIESKSMIQESMDKTTASIINDAKNQSKPKESYREYGVVYDTEEKQFAHKRKVVRIKV